MNIEEKKAIERIDYIQDFIIENGRYNADVNDMEYFSKILNLIEKQKAELDKKDRIIDYMAEYISKLDIDEDICSKNIINPQLCNEKYSNCNECIKEYFEKKVGKVE